jgi:Na+-driven multidrug efflux pump
MGFAQATPVRVGNLLGAGDPASAKVAAWTGGVLQAGVCIAIGAVIVALSPIWVGWFELDEVAVALLYEVMPLAAAWWLAIAVCCGGLRNNLQGMGLVRFSAVVQLIAFCESQASAFHCCYADALPACLLYAVCPVSCVLCCVLCVPRVLCVSPHPPGVVYDNVDPIGTLVAWLLGFGHTPLGFLGLKGLWMGNLTGFLFMFLCLGTYFCRVDWPLQSRLAVARSSKDRAGGSQAAAVVEEGEEGEGEAESLLSRDESS